MEIIRGKQTSTIDRAALIERLRGLDGVHLDIGTGDGRFVSQLALDVPASFVIGIDAARENLREASRRAPANALFVIANAERLPHELAGTAAHIAVNFPWGSLLTGLLTPGSTVLDGLCRAARAGAVLTVRLNAGALAEAGWTLEGGAAQVREALNASGFAVRRAVPLPARELSAFPSTWARRLAHGRDPRAVQLDAVLLGERVTVQNGRYAELRQEVSGL